MVILQNGFLDFREKKGVDWMVEKPLDCYDYSSRSSARIFCGAKKINQISVGLSKRLETLLWRSPNFLMKRVCWVLGLRFHIHSEHCTCTFSFHVYVIAHLSLPSIVHWLSSPIFPCLVGCSFVRPAMVTPNQISLLLAPHPQTHTFSESLW